MTVVPDGESGVSGGGLFDKHHKISVFAGFTIKRFEAIHLIMSSMHAETRLANIRIVEYSIWPKF